MFKCFTLDYYSKHLDKNAWTHFLKYFYSLFMNTFVHFNQFIYHKKRINTIIQYLSEIKGTKRYPSWSLGWYSYLFIFHLFMGTGYSAL